MIWPHFNCPSGNAVGEMFVYSRLYGHIVRWDEIPAYIGLSVLSGTSTNKLRNPHLLTKKDR